MFQYLTVRSLGMSRWIEMAKTLKACKICTNQNNITRAAMSSLHSMMLLINTEKTPKAWTVSLNIILDQASMMSIWVLKAFLEQWPRSRACNNKELKIMVSRSSRNPPILKVNRTDSIIDSWGRRRCCRGQGSMMLEIWKVERLSDLRI